MVDTYYLNYETYLIKDKNDFFANSGLKETTVLRNIYQTLKRMIGGSDSDIDVSMIDKNLGYELIIKSSAVKKYEIGRVYYLPAKRRLDIYDDSSSPIVSYVGKKCVLKNFSELMQRLKFENLFIPIASYL